MDDKLIGALIGLARATEGNEHLITPSVYEVMFEGLSAEVGADTKLYERVREEKKKLVPDCFYCAAPCGRNEDYDMSQFTKAPEETVNLKATLLAVLKGIAPYAHNAAKNGHTDKRAGEYFRKALYYLGAELDEDIFLETIKEGGEVFINIKYIDSIR